MLSVTIPNISPSQNTPVLPNIRRIVTRPSGASCSRRNSAKLSLATIRYPQSWPSDDDPTNGTISELSPNLGDGLRDQAAAVWDCEDAGLAATSIPSVN